jgi:alkanesulfonate monooxygenase
VIGSGYPHLEEAYRVAELLFPELGLGANARAPRRSIENEFGVGFYGDKRLQASS